jgi:hypothetical protein
MMGNQLVIANKTQLADDRNQEIKIVQEAFASMNEPLRTAAKNVIDLCNSLRRNVLLKSWKLGGYLRQIRDNEDKYGTSPLAKIDKVLDEWSQGVTYKAIRLNEVMTEAEVNELGETKTKIANRQLSWAHIEKLLTVTDQAKRKELVNEVVENDLTPEELQLMVIELRTTKPDGKKPKNNGGAPVAIPVTASACIVRASKRAKDIIRDASEIFLDSKHGIEANATNIAEDKIKPELISLLKETVDHYRDAEDSCREVRLAADQAIQILNSRMEAKAKKEAASTTKVITDKVETEKIDKKTKKVKAVVS